MFNKKNCKKIKPRKDFLKLNDHFEHFIKLNIV